MLEEENSLPGAKLKPALRYRNHLARSGQDHSDMRGGVVWSLGRVSEIISVLGDESLEIGLEIDASRTVGVFENHEARARVLDEHGGGPRPDSAFSDGVLDVVGDLVRALALGLNLERFGMRPHSTGLTRQPNLINDRQVIAAFPAVRGIVSRYRADDGAGALTVRNLELFTSPLVSDVGVFRG